MKEGTVAIGNSEVDYAVFGRGSRNMLMIPGLSLRDVRGSGGGLALAYRSFSKEFTVYCVDKKRDLPENCTIADLAEDYAAAMTALGLRSACVFGVSQGGMIAMYLAVNHPELVEKLVLGVTAARTNEVLTGCVRRWTQHAQAGDYEALALDFLPRYYSEGYLRRYGLLLKGLAKTVRPSDPARFIALARACVTCDILDRLPEIRCPVLVLGAGQDQILTGQASRDIAGALDCECHIYEDLGHAAFEEDKDFNRRVLEFFLR